MRTNFGNEGDAHTNGIKLEDLTAHLLALLPILVLRHCLTTKHTNSRFQFQRGGEGRPCACEALEGAWANLSPLSFVGVKRVNGRIFSQNRLKCTTPPKDPFYPSSLVPFGTNFLVEARIGASTMQ